jgi:tRNA nucleotidyltransferase (CCA-adding enzyme)
MHMPPSPGDAAILGRQPTDDQAPLGQSRDGPLPLALPLDLHAARDQLWRALRPERWPLPPSGFPPGTALVGGAVRDGLLGRLGETPDLDLVVDGDAIALCRSLQQQHGGACVVLDAERCMARLVLRGWSLDLARMEPGGLIGDLARRDYTINAMALPLAMEQPLVDPHGALAHLAAGELVAISEANLLDDPLRLLRGVRLASELAMDLEPRSTVWVERHRDRLRTVAPERVLAELWKLATTPLGHRGLGVALETGLLTPWLAPHPSQPPAALLALLSPERARALSLSEDEERHALPLARLAALLRPEGLAQLRSSRQLQQGCARLRPWQQRLTLDASPGNPPSDSPPPSDPATPTDPETLDERERLALHRTLEHDLPALLLQLPLEQARRWLQRWRNSADPLFHPRSPLNGADLQQSLGLKPSPRLGQLLDHLMRERAFGRIQGREEALGQARLWIDKGSESQKG